MLSMNQESDALNLPLPFPLYRLKE